MCQSRSKQLLSLAIGLWLAAFAASDAGAKVENRGPYDNWVEIHDATLPQHQSALAQWAPTHRVISLNLSGHPNEPRFASVWVRSSVSQDITPANCCTLAEMVQLEAANGVPMLISATGTTETNAKYAAAWEGDDRDLDTFLSLTQAELADQETPQKSNGRTLRWMSVYGTASNPLYTAVFERIPIPGTPAGRDGLPASVYTLGQDLNLWRENRDAHVQQWVRAGVLAPAPNDTFSTAWYDSLLGETRAFASLTPGQLQNSIVDMGRDGLFPMQVQAVVIPGISPMYCVLFAEASRLIADPEQRIGGIPRSFETRPIVAPVPPLPPFSGFDEKVRKLLQDTGVRAASAAIAYQGRLVHVRAYTWAEIAGGYPITETDRYFRLGSISKIYTAVTGFLLQQDSPPLDPPFLETLFVDIVGGNWIPNVNEITIADLLAHISGYPKNPDPAEDVSFLLHGGALVLPITNEQQLLYHVLTVSTTQSPGTTYGYSNLAYFMAGEALASYMNTSYLDLVGSRVFPELYYSASQFRPRPAAARRQDKLAVDVRHHTRTLGLTESVMDAPGQVQPLVPGQYGSQNHTLNAAAGGWSATAAQVAKLLASFALPADKIGPYTEDTLDAMLSPLELDDQYTKAGLTREPNSSSVPGGCLPPPGVTLYEKGGAVAGALARSLVRSDGVVVILLFNANLDAAAKNRVTPCKLNEWVESDVPDWSAFDGIDLFPSEDVPPFMTLIGGQ